MGKVTDDSVPAGDGADSAGQSPAAGSAASESPPEPKTADEKPVEIGGRDGPDPTRYGDWEKAGRCIDF